jgi:hypothetical protein
MATGIDSIALAQRGAGAPAAVLAWVAAVLGMAMAGALAGRVVRASERLRGELAQPTALTIVAAGAVRRAPLGHGVPARHVRDRGPGGGRGRRSGDHDGTGQGDGRHRRDRLARRRRRSRPVG